jgi:hypothetical protein
MPQFSAFGRTLATVRQQQGFATPYAFFRSRGGTRGLGLTFANYLSLERGKSLPKGWRLAKLISALDLMPESPKAKELVYAYLLDVLGSEELLKGLLSSTQDDPAPNTWKLAVSAARQAIGLTKVQLSVEQYKALARSADGYACHVVLCNTSGWVEAGQLAKTLKIPLDRVKKALKELAAAELAQLQGAKARSPFEKNYVAPPSPTPTLASIYAALQKYRTGWVEERGRTIHTPYLLLRARKPQMEKYFDHLTEAVNMSSLYGDITPADDSEMFLVEGKVVRLFPPGH